MFTMKCKHVILALMIMYCYEDTTAHILTSAHLDLPMSACMRLLSRAVLNSLCTSAEVYSPDSMYNDLPLIPREIASRNWELRQRTLQTCCSRPCAVSELLSMC